MWHRRTTHDTVYPARQTSLQEMIASVSATVPLKCPSCSQSPRFFDIFFISSKCKYKIEGQKHRHTVQAALLSVSCLWGCLVKDSIYCGVIYLFYNQPSLWRVSSWTIVWFDCREVFLIWDCSTYKFFSTYDILSHKTILRKIVFPWVKHWKEDVGIHCKPASFNKKSLIPNLKARKCMSPEQNSVLYSRSHEAPVS